MTAQDDEALGPPFSTDLLADLHADALPEDVSARLWPLVRQDPDALEVIAALDAVSARLGEVGRDDSLETPVPPEIAARINAALQEQAQEQSRPSDTVTSLADAPSRRRARSWFTVAAASTAAAAGIVFALTTLDGGQPEPPVLNATPPAENPHSPVTELGNDLDAGKVLALLRGSSGSAVGAGRLSDPEARARCLQANGIDRSAPLMGSMKVRFHGTDAVLMLVPGPHPPGLTALVVGTGCDIDTPDLLKRIDIG